MTIKQLSTQLTTTISSQTPEINLVLEQENVGLDEVNLRDVYNMLQYARNGQSARTYNPYGCGLVIDDTSITFSVSFFVWAFPLELPYSLSANIGIVDGGKYSELNRDTSILFPLSDSVSLGRVFSDLEYQWLTGVYDRYGNSIPPPVIIQNLGSLILPGSYFGEARIQFTEKGYKHELTVTIQTVDEDGNSLKIDDLDLVVTASWVNSEGDEQLTVLDLITPSCVKAALKMCDNKPNLICHGCGEGALQVFYNVCNGEVLLVRPVDPGNDGMWCDVA